MHWRDPKWAEIYESLIELTQECKMAKVLAEALGLTLMLTAVDVQQGNIKIPLARQRTDKHRRSCMGQKNGLLLRVCECLSAAEATLALPACIAGRKYM